ncbi:hypothetical protein KSS87_000353 [Heliosperma pusillum]|nr:hypothetical protein KSS87_000353 [Heliosperma pusillum]
MEMEKEKEEEEEEGVKLQIKFGGESIRVTASGSSRVSDLKSIIQEWTNVLPRGQKLIHKGRVLDDESASLRSYSITDGSKIMVMASRGLHQGEGPMLNDVRVVPNYRKVIKTTTSTSSIQVPLCDSRTHRWKVTGVIALSDSNLKAIPHQVWECASSVRLIDLTNNSISHIPLNITSFTSLQVDVSSNLLVMLPETLGSLQNLKSLRLSNNGLKSLPSSIFKKCVKLSSLDLHGTQITMDVLREVEGWEEFDNRRRMKYQKQLDFRAGGSAGFDEGSIEKLLKLAADSSKMGKYEQDKHCVQIDASHLYEAALMEDSIRDDSEADVDQLERFDDFTLASSWERFISQIEAVCRRWLAHAPRTLLEKGALPVGTSNRLYKAKYELKYDNKSYCMEYYFEKDHNGKVVNWDCSLHDLQLAFGVTDFMVIAPQSASGVVLDSPEASKLLSAVAIASSNCNSLWPAFVPVHDPSRKAHIGIQNMGTVFTTRYESDCIRSQVPVKLMHLEGLYELFVSKFAFSMLDFSMHLFKVQFTMKLTYRTLPYNDDGGDDDYMPEVDAEDMESSTKARGEVSHRSQWDDDCSWSEWYSAEDPVRGFELISIWLERTIESSLEMAEIENSSPHEAESWLLLPTLLENPIEGQKGKAVGFASQLSLLVDALEISFQAQFLEDFVSESSAESLKPSAAIPPPTVVDRILKEIFRDGDNVVAFSQDENRGSRAIKGAPARSLFAQFCLHSLWFGNCNMRAIATLWIEFVREVRWCWEESQQLPKISVNGAIDLSSCLIHQKLQMLGMCIEKKREANAEFFDAADGKDDVSDYIEEERQIQDDFLSRPVPSGSSDREIHSLRFVRQKQDGLYKNGEMHKDVTTLELAADCIRRGSAGVVGSMMLLGSHQRLHVPFTQDAPLMTEDMHEERLNAVAAFGNSSSFSAQLEREILSSDHHPVSWLMVISHFETTSLSLQGKHCSRPTPNGDDDDDVIVESVVREKSPTDYMSAFKAANPDAVFEDFIRWHSPGDWENDSIENSGISGSQENDNWPPRGRLSKRMSEHGNFWRKLWNDAPALPAYDQKPLLDPNREGEKILHYLETLRPHQLLEQMVCTAFRAAADTLNQAIFGDLTQMKAKLDQLYLTIASMLSPLQENQLSLDSETFGDLRRPSVIFEHIERLTIMATSLHRKFIQAPRLCSAMFGDYYNFYLPRMGNGEMQSDFDQCDCQKFNQRQQVRNNERNVVVDLFSPPSLNQSWRKVLSMGNLLNGHEPAVREIIFTMRDDVSGNHYAVDSPMVSEQQIETYRMYIQGTSNDLSVSLAVVSCD